MKTAKYLLVILGIAAILLASFGCKQITEPESAPLTGYWGSDQNVSGIEFYLHLVQKGNNIEGSGIWSEEIVMKDVKGYYSEGNLSIDFNMPYTNLGTVYWTISAKWYEADDCFKGELVGNSNQSVMKYLIKMRKSNKEYLFKIHNQGGGQ